jgi:hypothetical protein
VRNAFNALLRAGWWSFADALCDYASSQFLGKDGDESGTYFSDGLHPSTAGRAEQLYFTIGAVAEAANPSVSPPAHKVRFRLGVP